MALPINPPFYDQIAQGNGFIYHAPAAALLLTGTGGGFPTVINPLGSGKNFVPIKMRIGYLSGTTVIGGVLLAKTTGVGSQAATGAAIPTATLVAAQNALIGGAPGKQSVMQWSPTTNTFTSAPTVIAATGINPGASSPTSGSGLYETSFDGSLAWAPGTAMSVVYSVTTSTALFFVTIFGLEIPITQ
jgi:hypothetical protein